MLPAMGRWLCTWLVVSGTVASAQVVPSAEDVAAARELFHQGVEFTQQEQWEDAADRFRRAFQLRPSAIIAHNLSIAATHVGRLVEASEMLEYVRRQDEVDPAIRADADARVQALRPRLAQVRVILQGHPTGVRVRIDGRLVRAQTHAVHVPADPGDVQLEVLRGEEVVATAHRTLQEGESVEWPIDVPAPVVEVDPAEVARQDANAARVEAERARAEAQRLADERAAALEQARQERAASDRRRRRRLAGGITAAVLAIAGGALTAGLLLRSDGPQGTLPAVDWR